VKTEARNDLQSDLNVSLEIAWIPFSLLKDNCVKISFAQMDSYALVRGLLHCENKLFAESDGIRKTFLSSSHGSLRSCDLWQDPVNILTRCITSQICYDWMLTVDYSNMRRIVLHLQSNFLSRMIMDASKHFPKCFVFKQHAI